MQNIEAYDKLQRQWNRDILDTLKKWCQQHDVDLSHPQLESLFNICQRILDNFYQEIKQISVKLQETIISRREIAERLIEYQKENIDLKQMLDQYQQENREILERFQESQRELQYQKQQHSAQLRLKQKIEKGNLELSMRVDLKEQEIFQLNLSLQNLKDEISQMSKRDTFLIQTNRRLKQKCDNYQISDEVMRCDNEQLKGQVNKLKQLIEEKRELINRYMNSQQIEQYESSAERGSIYAASELTNKKQFQGFAKIQEIFDAQIDTLPYPKLLTLQEQKQKLKCPHKIPAFFVCIDPKCLVAGLMCIDSICQCTKTHYKCHYIQIDRVLDSIEKHQKQLPQEVRQSYRTTHQIINEMFGELSKIRSKLYLEERYFGLTEKEIFFMTLIDEQKIDKICGKIISELEETFESEISLMILSHEEIRRDFQMIRPEFTYLCKHIEDNYTKFDSRKIKFEEKQKGKLLINKWQEREIEKLQLKKMKEKVQMEELKEKIDEIKMENIYQMNKRQYINDSKILKQNSYKNMMYQWLTETSNKKKISSRLLFRASEHNFSAAEFHKHCDGVENTLVIVKTQHDKLIGGFTPNKWYSPGSSKYVNDRTGKAFLFSLTLKKKYKCTKPQYSINCNKDYGPIFGGCDLCLSDKAHNSGSSFADFPDVYNLLNQYKKNQQIYTLFSGATNGCKFNVKQYEVYEMKGM